MHHLPFSNYTAKRWNPSRLSINDLPTIIPSLMGAGMHLKRCRRACRRMEGNWYDEPVPYFLVLVCKDPFLWQSRRPKNSECSVTDVPWFIINWIGPLYALTPTHSRQCDLTRLEELHHSWLKVERVFRFRHTMTEVQNTEDRSGSRKSLRGPLTASQATCSPQWTWMNRYVAGKSTLRRVNSNSKTCWFLALALRIRRKGCWEQRGDSPSRGLAVQQRI